MIAHCIGVWGCPAEAATRPGTWPECAPLIGSILHPVWDRCPIADRHSSQSTEWYALTTHHVRVKRQGITRSVSASMEGWCLSFAWGIFPDNKVHGANMGPTWVLSAPDEPHVGPINLAIRSRCFGKAGARCYYNTTNFLQNTLNRHSIVQPSGVIVRLLRIQSLICQCVQTLFASSLYSFLITASDWTNLLRLIYEQFI